MLHFRFFDVRTDVFVLMLCMCMILVQLVLCFKAKSKGTRLIPVCFLTGMIVMFVILAFIFDGWNRVGMFLLTGVTAFLLISSAIGWVIWYLLRKKLR